jgi:co-chaperonin GroES (HSP10)
MKVKSVGYKLELEVPTSKVGALHINTGDSIQEIAIVKSVGELCSVYKKGDKILFKSYAVDIIIIDDEKFYSIDEEIEGEPNPAICFLVTT